MTEVERHIERAGWMARHPLKEMPVHVVTREWFDEQRLEAIALREAARAVVKAWQRGDGEREAMATLIAALDAFGGQ